MSVNKTCAISSWISFLISADIVRCDSFTFCALARADKRQHARLVRLARLPALTSHSERSREWSEWDERHGRLRSVGRCERIGRRTSQISRYWSLNEPPVFRRQFKMAFGSERIS